MNRIKSTRIVRVEAAGPIEPDPEGGWRFPVLNTLEGGALHATVEWRSSEEAAVAAHAAYPREDVHNLWLDELPDGARLVVELPRLPRP